MKTNLFRNIVQTRRAASLLLLLLAFAACDPKDDGTTPNTGNTGNGNGNNGNNGGSTVTLTLEVDPPAIPATSDGGSYPIAVTSNATWTATVGAGAVWCTLDGSTANGTGNGTVTVNIVANPAMAPRAATVTIAAGTLTEAVAVTQDALPPDLTVMPTAIDTTAVRGFYRVEVTCNAAWTATVGAGATWCVLEGTIANGTGNGTITVIVDPNTSGERRAATVTVAAGSRSCTIPVTQDLFHTPPYAASTHTWVFGAQTWSNAIHITSGCNKQHFPTEHGTAYCRSYSEGGTTWYYYNWKYVDQYAVEQLCPGPWRVPTKEDFDTLVGHTDAAALISAWGYGGRAYDTAMEVVATDAYYWSATLLYNGADNAHNLHYSASTLSVDSNSRPHGFQVRCVK